MDFKGGFGIFKNLFRNRQAAKAIWKYLESLDRYLLVSQRADADKGTNHCVYEDRISVTGPEQGESLENILKGQGCCGEKGLIILEAPSDGYAKDYFAARLLTICFDSLMKQKEENGNSFRAMESRTEAWFRVPIVVEREAVHSFQGVDNLDSLSNICASSIKLWLEKKENFPCNEKEFACIQSFVSDMLEKGHMLLLFPRGSMEQINGLYSLVVNVLCKEKEDHGNIAIYVAEEDSSFCNPQYGYTVKLDSLSEEEILGHIQFVMRNDDDMVGFFRILLQNNELLKKELQIPERLLLLSKFFPENDLQDVDAQKTMLKRLKSAAQFYNVIIDSSIDICVRKYCGYNTNKNAIKAVRDGLSRLAWQELDNSNKNDRLPEEMNRDFLNSLKKTSRDRLGEGFRIWETLTKDSDFLVDDDKGFLFIGCKHYLIAEKLMKMLQKEDAAIKTVLCNPVFFEKANSQIFDFLMDMIQDDVKEENVKRQYFDIVWNSVTNDRMAGESNRVQILVNAMERLGWLNDLSYSDRFLSFILKELSSQYYDSHVFDTIQDINRQYPRFGINNYLLKRYDGLRGYKEGTRDSIDNQKRRLAYYFGKVKCGITEAMVEDLIDPGIHVHVKYHIILAVIENYDLSHTEELLKKYEDRIVACEDAWKEDCILYSDYLLLQSKRNNVERGHGEFEIQLQRKLYLELGKSEYWRRAHAAGALGRLGLYGSAEKLMSQLRIETQQIETEKDSLKAVSYIVEAVCELFYRQNKDIVERGENQDRRQNYEEGLERCQKDFVNLMVFAPHSKELYGNTEILLRFLIASATISEGIIYLDGPVKNRIPEDIGRHIKDGKKDLGGKCSSICKGLDLIESKYGEEGGGAKEKREMMCGLRDRVTAAGRSENGQPYAAGQPYADDGQDRPDNGPGSSVCNNEAVGSQQNIDNGGIGVLVNQTVNIYHGNN